MPSNIVRVDSVTQQSSQTIFLFCLPLSCLYTLCTPVAAGVAVSYFSRCLFFLSVLEGQTSPTSDRDDACGGRSLFSFAPLPATTSEGTTGDKEGERARHEEGETDVYNGSTTGLLMMIVSCHRS